ncbi:MAG: radical SAM protein [Thermosynechococcaceae cyanobacterium MS004]|nr:radical SAM protein [Thermosynechococcaceae cyanobacterium MS004]
MNANLARLDEQRDRPRSPVEVPAEAPIEVPPEVRKVHFVVKVSKFCNLRCRYCYEYAELSDREAMSLDQLDQLYLHLADYYRQFGQSVEIELDWQGGEALLLPPEFYWQTFARQRDILGGLSVKNAVQTNLTVLTEDRIHLLKHGFDAVGVSIDLFGGLRVFSAGEDSQARVLANLDRLQQHKVDFGCITVLTKRNVDHISQIYRFYEALKVNSFRILPLVKGAFENQHQDYELSTAEVESAFQALFELVLTQPGSVQIDPLNRWIAQVMHHQRPEAQPNFYHKREWENVYLINTNGDVFSYADAYQEGWRHGNLFESSMRDIVLSEAHQKAITAAERRMAAVCHGCRFFGSCDGYPVAEESVLHQTTEPLDCGVEKKMLSYIERRLQEIGVIQCPIRPLPLSMPSTHELAALSPGIQIQFAQSAGHSALDCGENRILLSQGTAGATECPVDGLRYHPGARVPQAPWRSPTVEEQRILVDFENNALDLAITVLKIPDYILEPLRAYLAGFGIQDRWNPNPSEQQFLNRHPLDRQPLDRQLTQGLPLNGQLSAHPMMREIHHYLQAHFEDYRPSIFTLYSAPPNLKTLTKNDNQEQQRAKMTYLGLHLDSWDQSANLPPQRRFCLNLGKEDRHFLFINLPWPALLNAVGVTSDRQVSAMSRTLFSGHAFMKRYPEYPVVKLRIAPGEAYIAPTGHLIHDGTSEDKQYPDVTLHVLGAFGAFLQHKLSLSRPQFSGSFTA